jgi:hypothetical protein
MPLGGLAVAKRPAPNLWPLNWRWHWKRGAHPPPSSASFSTSISFQDLPSPHPTEGSGAAAQSHRHAAHLADRLMNVSSIGFSSSTITTSTPASASSSTLTYVGPIMNPGSFHRVAAGLMHRQAAEASLTVTSTTKLASGLIAKATVTHCTVTNLYRRHEHDDGLTTQQTRISSAHRPKISKGYAHRPAQHLKHSGGVVTTITSLEEEEVSFEAQATHHRATGLFRRHDQEHPFSTTLTSSGRHSTASVVSRSSTTSTNSMTAPSQSSVDAKANEHFSFDLNTATTQNGSTFAHAKRPAENLFWTKSTRTATTSSLLLKSTTRSIQNAPTDRRAKVSPENVHIRTPEPSTLETRTRQRTLSLLYSSGTSVSPNPTDHSSLRTTTPRNIQDSFTITSAASFVAPTPTAAQ